MAEVQEIEIRDSAAKAAAVARSFPPAEDLQDMQGEKMVLNMGPSHPSTHGVLRIVLELDGEMITKAMPDIAFTKVAPIEGGPFVTAPAGKDAIEREPRAKTFEG